MSHSQRRLPIDIIVAHEDHFDDILGDIQNAAPRDETLDAGVSIDDVVTFVALHRGAINDRQAWWKIRREVNTRFASHQDIPSRTLALLPETVRDEIASFDEADVRSVSDAWITRDDATPSSLPQAIHSLTALVDACSKALAESKGIFLRTSQPPNAFEAAFSQLDQKRLANFRKAFDRWDEIKKHEAHQKYNYYTKQGLENGLDLVLRDFTRPKTAKVNLKTDQRTIQRHIKKRVKQYCKSPNPGLGDANDPITMITLTFDIEYEGYVDFDFDTRPDAAQEIRWEEHTEECLEFIHWNEGMQRFSCDGLPLKMTLHGGSKIALPPDTDTDVYETHIGEMLRDTLLEARDAGEFAKLPLADNCLMWVGGTHATYSWPDLDNLRDQDRVN